MGERQTGKVLWFDKARGYGFIRPNGGARDVFVHYSGIDAAGYRQLHSEQIVSFDVVDAPKGPLAINVRVTN